MGWDGNSLTAVTLGYSIVHFQQTARPKVHTEPSPTQPQLNRVRSTVVTKTLHGQTLNLSEVKQCFRKAHV